MITFPPLVRGRILRRYKRFLADIQLPDGTVVTAHCPNTGSMTGCWEPGAPAEMSHSDNPRRKLQWTLERVDMGQGWIGVNTARTTRIIASFLEQGLIPGLDGYATFQHEPGYLAPGFPNSRLDGLLTAAGRRDCYVEVKNATLYSDDAIRFPDAVTVRGKKHLQLLQHAVSCGHRGVILFAVNRPEGMVVSPAWKVDPDYARTLQSSVDSGVEAFAVRIQHTTTGVRMGGLIPMEIRG